MTDINEIAGRLRQLLDERILLESRLQAEKGEVSSRASTEYDRSYNKLQKSLAQLFRDAKDESQRVTIMLELIRILENKLVYLQNFVVDPTSDNRTLASLVMQFIDEVSRTRTPVLTPLEATYYRAVVALYAGDLTKARESFRAACESEESDESNDIKYKSYVILGHLSHQESDYQQARELHDQSLKYTHSNNVSAQALAFKALNVYALKDFDEALRLFEESLQLFDRNEPFFNSYFHRNALLFCGSIHFERKGYDRAQACYREVLDHVEPNSYDHFDALSQLGKIDYLRGKFDDAAKSFTDAVQTHKFSENEYLVDTYFWLAKTHLKRNQPAEAKRYLEKIAASDVNYDKKPQAADLLEKVS